MKTIARKRKSGAESHGVLREQARKQPELGGISCLSDASQFNQIYAPILGLTCSLFNDRLTGRSHIESKPFVEFKLLRETLAQIYRLPSVKEDVDLNAAFKIFDACLPHFFDKEAYAETGRVDGILFHLFVEMGHVALNALRLAGKRENLDDMLLGGKLAIIASYFLELAPGVAEKERTEIMMGAVMRTQRKFHAKRIGAQLPVQYTLRTGRQQVHNFMISDFLIKAVGEATMVHETVNDMVKHAYTDAKVGLDKLHRASTRIGIHAEQTSAEKSETSTNITPTSGTTKSKQPLVKVKRLPQHVRDTLRKALMVDFVYSFFNRGEDRSIVGIQTVNLSVVNIPSFPSIWFSPMGEPNKKSKTQTFVSLFEQEDKIISYYPSNHTVDIFQSKSGETKRIQIAKMKKVTCSTVASDDQGAWLINGTHSGQVLAYNLDTQKKGLITFEHKTPVSAIKFDYAMSRLFSASEDGAVLVHSLILWNTDQVLLTGSPVTCMATDERYELNLFESASVLAVGCRDGKIHVYNLLSSRVVEEFTITTGQRAISHLAVSQGEIFSADAYSIHVYDIGTRFRVKEFIETDRLQVSALAISKTHLFTAFGDVLKVYDLDDWALVKHVQLLNKCGSLETDRANKLLIGSKKQLTRVYIEGLVFGSIKEDTGGVLGTIGESTFIDESGQDGWGRDSIVEHSPPPLKNDFTLVDILNNPVERREFMIYLKSLHADENLAFWVAVSRYEQIFDVISKRGKEREIRRILDWYIVEGAPFEVNISAKQRRSLLNLGIDHFDAGTFTPTKAEVLLLMDSNAFYDYKKVRRERVTATAQGADQA